ncbi:hypothetical protein EZV73_22055 [Acidaminobacter sp. JC074]|uniref:hypothetical protein n=1 Tax=Acidaminobacter sp. JC074 TaxID=2530199 RepID=UPI001F0F3E71|nr:hypothetical protein [Acidaminobacter sp. JC074]MCH4890282.1 hypothetical protein [Acidaminobacter sp. JC074]
MKKYLLCFLLALLLVSCESRAVEPVVEKPVVEIVEVDEVEEEEDTIEEDVSVEALYVRVLSDNLNVRQAPEEKSDVVSQLVENDLVKVVDEITDDQDRIWYQDDSLGWFASWYCKPVAINSSSEKFDFIVNLNETTKVYLEVGSTEVIGQAKKGQYRILETYVEDANMSYWYRILTSIGINGWILGTDLSEETRDKKVIDLVKIEEVSDKYVNAYNDFYDKEFIDLLKKEVENVDYLYSLNDSHYIIIGYDIDGVDCISVYDKNKHSLRFIGHGDYLYADRLLENQFLVLDYNDDQTFGKKIVDLSLEGSITDYQSLGFENFALLETYREKIFLLEMIDSESSLSGLYYYQPSLDYLTPFKVSGDISWTYEIDEDEVVVYKVDDQKHEIYREHSLEWLLPIIEDHAVYTRYQIREYLDLNLSTYSDEDIIKHLFQVDDYVSYVKYGGLSRDDDDYLYFSIFTIESLVGYSYFEHTLEEYLVKWKKNSSDYELILKVSPDDYFNQISSDMSPDEIEVYLNQAEVLVEGLTGIETKKEDGLFITEYYRRSTSEDAYYYRLIIADENGKTYHSNVYFSTDDSFDNLIITLLGDEFSPGVTLINLDLFRQELDCSLSLSAGRYELIPDTDWLILESWHPYPDGYHTLPPVTDVEFINIKTLERLPFRVHDTEVDYLYTMNEETSSLEIYKKNIGDEEGVLFETIVLENLITELLSD